MAVMSVVFGDGAADFCFDVSVRLRPTGFRGAGVPTAMSL
jgi:hypothetical protein